MAQQEGDDLQNLLTKANHDLTVVEHRLEKKFENIYPDNVNPVKLVSRVKSIQDDLSSLKDQCRGLLAAKQMATSTRPSLPPFEEANQQEAHWTVEQEYFFIDMMLHYTQEKGENRQAGTFSKEEWMDMRRQFYNQFGKKYGLKQMKNKEDHLKRRYNAFKKLLQGATANGLGWDPVLKTVIASDEWWANYVKTNPEVKKFRHQGCPEYELLALIFGDTVAKGDLQASTTHDFDSTDGEEHVDEKLVETAPITPFEGTSAPVQQPKAEPENVQPLRARSRTPTSTRRGRKDSKSSELSEALNRIAEVGQNRVERRDKYSITECIEIIDRLCPDLHEVVYMQAMKMLQDKTWREAFLAWTDERRKGWFRSIESGVI